MLMLLLLHIVNCQSSFSLSQFFFLSDILISLNTFVPLNAFMHSFSHLSAWFMDHDKPLKLNVLSLCFFVIIYGESQFKSLRLFNSYKS